MHLVRGRTIYGFPFINKNLIYTIHQRQDQMVVESLMSPLRAEKKPWLLFFLGFLYNSIAIIVSLKIFYDQASMLMVFLTVLGAGHLMYLAMKNEEKKDMEIDSEITLLREHGKALLYLIMLFIGITLSCTVWYIFLPAEASGDLFQVQTETILKVNSKVTGQFFAGFNFFTRIFVNNITVMIYCTMAGLLYGLGAIFILTWNASVIGVAIGSFFREKLALYAGAVGFERFASYLYVAPWSIMRYFFHGIPEILAYFIAGLAGGIISMAFINGHFATKRGEKIFLDAANLIILAIVTLVFAALLEVYITPILF
jgi:uncharacterized membrane protein SpoIIM required for sporulation